MGQIKYIALIMILLLANVAFAQKNERSYLRSGNKLYTDSLFEKAEVDYRKALDSNAKSTEAMYNLGNTLSNQQKAKEAMEQYDAASRIENNKMKLSQIYHNMGVLQQAGKQYEQAIQAYKQALRNNPKDDETRYNLALAQKLLKDQQQQNQDKDKQDQQQEKKKQEQDKKEQEKKEQEEQKKQDQQQQPPKPEQNKNEMSKENAQQLLNAAMQDEKQTQDKVKKMQQVRGKKLDKDW